VSFAFRHKDKPFHDVISNQHYEILIFYHIYRVSGKKVPLLIEILVGITLNIQLKEVLFSGHPVSK